ncbi:uncharacterized protein (DUF1330 family) [Bradyrhizobium sp. USDA 4341]
MESPIASLTPSWRVLTRVGARINLLRDAAPWMQRHRVSLRARLMPPGAKAFRVDVIGKNESRRRLIADHGDDIGLAEGKDKDSALAWYNSPAYQALLDFRDAALDCRFRLIG